MKLSLKVLGDSFFCDDMNDFVKKQPYMSFVIMSTMLEFLGKCNRQCRDFQATGCSEDYCYRVINNLSALSKYTKFNYKQTTKKGKDKDSNYLYTCIRCGMLHAFIPEAGILLSDKQNDIDNNRIGALDLYNDLCAAWNELKGKADILKYLENKLSIEIDGTSSGNPQTSITKIVY